MKYCPLMSFRREGWQTVFCLGDECAFADAAGECFIRQALECYVSKERTSAAIAAETERKYNILHKDGHKYLLFGYYKYKL